MAEPKNKYVKHCIQPSINVDAIVRITYIHNTTSAYYYASRSWPQLAAKVSITRTTHEIAGTYSIYSKLTDHFYGPNALQTNVRCHD